MGVGFSVKAWSFYDTPGEKPELPQVPAMLRRRASGADRMALKVAFETFNSPASVATVFCSRHGEEHRSVELLSQMAAGEGQSAMSFSLSVHNAASGLFGIARGDRTASTALSAGKETLAMGMIEACGLLSRGVKQVLLVNYDDALPVALKNFADETDRPYALAMLLEAGSTFQLERLGGDSSSLADPQGICFAGFLKSEALDHVASGWRWTRSA